MSDTNQKRDIYAEAEEKYAQLEQAVGSSNASVNLTRLREAYEFALKAHGNQMRKDGSLYITHPVATAVIVNEMGLDEQSLIAALLHDVLEDTPVTHAEIESAFGTDVAELVEGVTKLTRVQYTSKEEEQMDNLRKMLMAMAKDIRVILIKIADRLHNARTFEFHSPEKQLEKAAETMDIYAPIAHRLGMSKIELELEDLSLKFLDPVACEAIQDGLAQMGHRSEEFMAHTQQNIEQHLARAGIKATVTSRIKHIYSIYRKMYGQNKELSEILDLYAFRVIVDNVTECYNVLGHLHEMYKPIPGHFKDYIGTPKQNMYQSLHTTVIGSEGIPFEVQIRTWEMHETAEYGVAAHWKYKEGIVGKTGDEERFEWIRRLLETQQDAEAQDFIHTLKVDMFGDEVFVFTPQGDVINLPVGSTPIDFAYCIHSALGNRMTGAMINGRIVPFTTQLQNGDIVQVITSGSSKGPSRDWLNIVKSQQARSKIRQWIKKEKRDENIAQGRASLESELKRLGCTLRDVSRADVSQILLKRYAFPSLDELYAAIGYGGLSAQKTANSVRDIIRGIERDAEKAEELQELERAAHDAANQPQTARPAKAVHGVIVENIDSVLVKFANCCSPVPGDQISGFITRGSGVSVHRQDCINYLRGIENPEERGRWVKVEWAKHTEELYPTQLKITAVERSGLVMDIATVINSLKVKMTTMTARDEGNGISTAYITVEVHDVHELMNTMNRLNGISGVNEVQRVGGKEIVREVR